MKKYILLPLIAAVMTAVPLQAQGPVYLKLDLDESLPYALPETVVKIKVVVEKEVTKPGPYARFAQKYIGSIAPMTEKTIFSIKSAQIDYLVPGKRVPVLNNKRNDKPTRSVVSHVRNSSDFTKSYADRMSMAEKSAEESARDAANTIYTLRKRRFDLVTGEAGEHVYGEGLKAAIDEMSRLENELLALFFGKQTTVTETFEFEVVPETGKTNYIAFRFSPATGILPATDLSGNPVVLSVQPEGKVKPVATKTDKRFANFYRVADWAECKLSDGNQEFASERVPVYQFGATIQGR